MSLPAALARRERVAELMDDPALDPAEHRRALRGLARLNWVSDSPGLLWPAVRDLARGGGPVRVLDVATGSGDVPRALAARAARAGLTNVTFAGCDISPTAVESAARAAPGLTFFVHDAVRDPLPGGYDVVTCSLFLHHLSEADAVVLLGRMAAAGTPPGPRAAPGCRGGPARALSRSRPGRRRPPRPKTRATGRSCGPSGT